MNPTKPIITSHPAQREESVREHAYFLWRERGCPVGQDWDDWFAAEQHVLSTMPGADVKAPASTGGEHFSIKTTLASHLSDPTHRFHAPGAAHDDRLSVIAGEARQRVRGRRFGGSLRSQPKTRQ